MAFLIPIFVAFLNAATFFPFLYYYVNVCVVKNCTFLPTSTFFNRKHEIRVPFFAPPVCALHCIACLYCLTDISDLVQLNILN